MLLSLAPMLATYAVTGEYGSWQIRHPLDVLERWGAVKENGMPIIDLLDIPFWMEVTYVFVAAALLGTVLGSLGYGLKRLISG